MTEKSEKCFIPVVINSLKAPLLLGAILVGGVAVIVGAVIICQYLTDLAVSTGYSDAFSAAVNTFGVAVVQNSLLIVIGSCILFILGSVCEVKKGNKNTGYSILAILVLPLIVSYFSIRSVFWLHMFVLTNTGLYETDNGLAWLILLIVGLILWAVCSALINGIDTCYKDDGKYIIKVK